MATPILRVDPVRPAAPSIERAVQVLSEGGVLALPTETFYGLAADSRLPQALVRVNRIKGKPQDSPLLLLAADPAQARAVARDVPGSFEALAGRCWPGPLTLVLVAAPSLSTEVGGGRGTVGVRVPGLALPRRLAERLGRPICGPSANRHGDPAPRTAGELGEVLVEALDLVLDGGPTRGGQPSTLLDLTVRPHRMLRAGAISQADLEATLGEEVAGD